MVHLMLSNTTLFLCVLYLMFWEFTKMGSSVSLSSVILPSSQWSFSILIVVSRFSTGKEECRKPVILVTHSYMDLEVSFLCVVPFPLTSYAEPELSISLMFCILIHSLSCRVLALFPIFQKCFEVLYTLMVAPTTHCLGLILSYPFPFMVSLPSWIREPSFQALKMFGMAYICICFAILYSLSLSLAISTKLYHL